MYWDIVNTDVLIPECIFCGDCTKQMIRFHTPPGTGHKWICITCSRDVRKAVTKIAAEFDGDDNATNPFNSDYIDESLSKNKYNKPT